MRTWGLAQSNSRVWLCLQAAPRVLFMRAFAHLFEGKPSGLNTLNILRSNGHMNALQHAINQAVIDDFTAAKEAVRVSVALLPGASPTCLLLACLKTGSQRAGFLLQDRTFAVTKR